VTTTGDGLEELGRDDGAHGEVVLRRRTTTAGAHLELVVDGVFAMDDVDTSTERALATEGLARCPGDRLRVLVGGLGLGWTAATALADPRVAAVEVVEQQPALVRWARAGLLPALPAGDDRLTLTTADVAEHLAGHRDRYDVVLLDVDNGPSFLVHQTNAGLYEPAGLAAAVAALRPGGVLALWASDPVPALVERLAALPATTGTEHLVLPVERDGHRFEYAVALTRRA
jgi:spermidine synthase